MLSGKFIGVAECANTFVLEQKFTVRSAKQVRLRATALGVYFAEVNGVRVGDGYLAPGWTSYNKTLQVQEYDIHRPRAPYRYEAHGLYADGQRAFSKIVRKRNMGAAGELCGYSDGLSTAGRTFGLDGGHQRVLPHGGV